MSCSYLGLKSGNKLNDCEANDASYKLFKTAQCSYKGNCLCQTDQLEMSPLVFCATTCPAFYFGMALNVNKHYYISMSSSPELWATGKLYRVECVSAGGLEGLRGL